MESAHKSYHRSEPWVSGSGLREIKKLLLTAARATCKRRGREEGAVSSLNSSAWESFEFHMAGSRAQSSGQKIEKRDGTTEKL